MVEVTLMLDEATLAKLDQAAILLNKSKSEVLCDAVQQYRVRTDRLTEKERDRILCALNEHLGRVPKRSREDVDRELKEIRDSRRTWGRRTPLE